ncbi:uncharacterized protein PRCAT00005491001 [Priceomyces carsonii]|uniref:uncharacterized protein n=1 Tax=Priceomyces carsonii TaxID=28549 RepID=UPI002ED817EA|nr:unnamed protein product [Priceomyces carsonii]
MLSQLTKQTLRSSVRSFSMTRVVATEGSINQANDSFSDKERAQETVYIRKHEQEQLKALKEKLEKQKETISKLEDQIDGLKKN